MQDPIDRLLKEHQEIMREVARLRAAVHVLEERGDAAIGEVRPLLHATARMVEGELQAHARREDEALFPALERVFGNVAGPTAVMRQEHRDIHAQADRFRATLRELNEVEHPAILAGGERLDALAASGAGAAELRSIAAELVRLLDDHFRKEEVILFPMAREILDPDELQAVAQVMESLGA